MNPWQSCPTSWRWTSTAALLALLAFSSGCGSRNETAVGPTKAQAEAAASAINLIADDLVGYTGKPVSPGRDDDPTDIKLKKCLRVKVATQLANAPSDDFARGTLPRSTQFGSEVAVVDSIQEARAELAAFSGGRAISCFKEAETEDLRSNLGDGTTFSPLAFSKIPSPVTGTDGAYAYSFSTTISGATQLALTFTLDGFLVKHTEVLMITAGIGAQVSTVERTAALERLVTRAKVKAV